MANNYIKFIEDEVLLTSVGKVLKGVQHAVDDAEKKLYKNGIDPFSGLFDSCRQGIGIIDWLEQEKARQIQKTMQNAIGDFHHEILGSVTGWQDLKKVG